MKYEQSEYERAARVAKLRYVDCNDPGIRRKKWGTGFTFVDPDGEHIRKGTPERERLDALAIPPAWTDVWVCPTENGHIQVTGRDEEGRKQYIYHERWEAVRQQVKFSRMADFARHLPLIRERYHHDMTHAPTSREGLVATVVALLDRVFLRVGNRQYTERHGSRGATTLTPDNVHVRGQKVEVEFVAKSGKVRKATLRDRSLARQLRRCSELPGQQLFTWFDEEGQPHPISSHDVNAWLRAVTAEDYTSKDFRTWGGTVTAANALARRVREEGLSRPGDSSERAIKAALVAAVDEAAEALGNTRATCRAYYVHPAVFEAFRTGRLHDLAQAAPLDLVVVAETEEFDERHHLRPEEVLACRLIDERLREAA